MKFAVIATGGKQYKVAAGDSLKIEKLLGDHAVGGKVNFDQVLMVAEGDNATIGAPTVKGAVVEATIEEIGRAAKVVVIHYKQKSRYYKKNGHRQPFFKMKIDAIK